MEINMLDYQIADNQKDTNIVLYYKGQFDDNTLQHISVSLREHFKDTPRIGKKVFAVCIELAQNIAYYSEEFNYFGNQRGKHGIGMIFISEDENQVTLKAGNIIKREDLKDIIHKCNQINLMGFEELRLLKRETRSEPRRDGHQGGNFGLVQVALKSESSLMVESKSIDSRVSFFTLSTYVTKENH